MEPVEVRAIQGSDEDLLQRYYDGDETAFLVLEQRYAARLHRFTRQIVGHDEDAWDVVQDMWISIVTKRPAPVNVHHLLYQKCIWLALDGMRSRGRRKTDQADDTLEEIPDRRIGTDRMLDRLTFEKLLDSLSDQERQVILLRLEDFGNGEIAAMLAISEGHSSNLYRSAAEKMNRAFSRTRETRNG